MGINRPHVRQLTKPSGKLPYPTSPSNIISGPTYSFIHFASRPVSNFYFFTYPFFAPGTPPCLRYE